MALVRKDLRLELRTRETIVAMVLFAIVMLAILTGSITRVTARMRRAEAEDRAAQLPATGRRIY